MDFSISIKKFLAVAKNITLHDFLGKRHALNKPNSKFNTFFLLAGTVWEYKKIVLWAKQAVL